MPKTKHLTVRKQKWADRRKPELIKGSALKYNAAIQERYYNELSYLIRKMTDETEKKIKANLKTEAAEEFFSMDESVASSSRILTSALRQSFTQLFRKKAKGLAERMVDSTDKATSGALHESLKQLSGGLSLGTRVLNDQAKEILKASITENVSLIKSIPEKYFTAIEGAVMRSITTGNGLADLVPFLSKHKSVTLRRARFIAGDQSRKVYSNIAAARMKELNTDKYIWRHSAGDQEPRSLHVQLSGTVQSLSNPPIIQYAKGSLPEVRGKPGDLINCTCFMQPVIDFSGE